MKKLLFRIAVDVVVLLVAGLLVVFFSLNSIVKKGVETVGPQLTKVEMRLDGVNLSPLSGNGHLNGLFVGNPEGFKTASAIKVGDIKVSLQLSSLLSDTVVVESVNIQSPEITFEGALDGKSNLSKILDNIESAAGSGGQKADQPASTSGKKFHVKDVVVKGGVINLSATILGGQALSVSLPDLHLQNIGTGAEGVSAAELSQQILEPLLASVTKAAGEELKNRGKGLLDKEATEQLNKVSKGVKELFKK